MVGSDCWTEMVCWWWLVAARESIIFEWAFYLLSEYEIERRTTNRSRHSLCIVYRMLLERLLISGFIRDNKE
jgi:hypothetical protein